MGRPQKKEQGAGEHEELALRVWDGARRVGRGPSSQKRQEAGIGQRVIGHTGATHPFWKKPTKAVLVRIVHPLADPEDGDAGGILSLLWDGNRQMIWSEPGSYPQ